VFCRIISCVGTLKNFLLVLVLQVESLGEIELATKLLDNKDEYFDVC
jgi:hypothetical protein